MTCIPLCNISLRYYNLSPSNVMMNLAQFVCMEQPYVSALSTKLPDDKRRLSIFLTQEERFMPNNYQTTKLVRNYEEERAKVLEVMYETVCPQPKKSDAFHLAVNLMDRYLGYKPPSNDEQFRTVACACTMISMKIRRARKECLNYDILRQHFYRISEEKVRAAEKEIAMVLKWDLNAVTAADFIEELSEKLVVNLTLSDLDKIIDHSHTIANVCMLYRCFMNVPPSLLACACICDAISHCCTQDKYLECVASLTQLAGIDQVKIEDLKALNVVLKTEILFQHQKNVSEIFLKKLEQSTGDSKSEEQYTPNDIESVEEQEFGHGRFVYIAPPSVEAHLIVVGDTTQPSYR